MNRNGKRKTAKATTVRTNGRLVVIDEKNVAEFDKEFIADTFAPLKPADKTRWTRAKKRGRPRLGKGVKVISVSIEQSLLNRADRAARRKGVSRASLIAAGLEVVLTHEN